MKEKDKNDLKDESSDDEDLGEKKVETLENETIWQMASYFDYKICIAYIFSRFAIEYMNISCDHFLGDWAQNPEMNQGFNNIIKAAQTPLCLTSGSE